MAMLYVDSDPLPHNFPGKFILFEGPEGAGKSTIVKKMAEKLRSLGYDVVETREPGHDTPLGKEIRETLMNPNNRLTAGEELMLFERGRADHFDNIVIPALKAGKIVLCDRSTPSTIAYQSFGRSLPLEVVLRNDHELRRGVGFDLVVLVDVETERGLARKQKDNRFEMETIEFHRRVREGYLKQATEPDALRPWVRPWEWRVVDGNKPPEEVAADVWKILSEKLVIKETLSD